MQNVVASRVLGQLAEKIHWNYPSCLWVDWVVIIDLAYSSMIELAGVAGEVLIEWCWAAGYLQQKGLFAYPMAAHEHENL